MTTTKKFIYIKCDINLNYVGKEVDDLIESKAIR